MKSNQQKHSQSLHALISICTLAFAIIVVPTQSKALYDPVKSYVAIYNQKNFDSQVTNNRQKGISIVHFYKDSDGVSKGFVGSYENFGKENKGMFRIGSVDCNEFSSICSKEKITKFPTLRVYPPFPAPTQDYEEDTLDAEKIKKMAARFITSRVIELSQNNFDTFLDDQPGKPKVLLFTDKKGTPLVYKALSSHFDKTLLFGLIRNTESGLVSKYKVKSFPSLILIKTKDAKPNKYEGSDYSYQGMFDFINVYSETFVFKNVNEEEVKSAASKPWLSERVPSLNGESGNDICLKKEGALCVVYIAKNEQSKNNEQLDTLYQVGQQFSSKISRGINFYFMWLDASSEPDFFKLFKLDISDLPQVVILNPGKRKRYLIHKGGISENELSSTLDKILGGDAKFTNIKENQLPQLVSKHPETK